MPGALVILSGALSFLQGLAAILGPQFFFQLPNYAYDLPIAGWGWTHLIIGIAMLAAGAGLLTGTPKAPVAAVALAGLCAVASFVYIPYSSTWSVVNIALDVLIICALLPLRRQATG
jgi:hypothetical protein